MYMYESEGDDSSISTEVIDKRSKGFYGNKHLNNCVCKTYLTARNSKDHGRLRKKCRCY